MDYKEWTEKEKEKVMKEKEKIGEIEIEKTNSEKNHLQLAKK